jgi:cation diffusion facilitator family transporter
MEQYIFSFLVALLIFTLGGAYSLYEGIHKILHPSESIPNVMINVIILSIAIVLESYSSLIATRELKKTKGHYSFFQYLRRTKDQILVTVLFEDFAALIGLVVAMAGILGYMVTGLVIFDSIATILIGVLLILIAVFLYGEAKSLLLGEAAAPEDQVKIKAAFSGNPNVESVKELLTMHLSPYQILVTAHVKFRTGISLAEVENAIDDIEDQIIEQVPEVYKIFIETHQKAAVEELQGTHAKAVGNDKESRQKKTMISRGRNTIVTKEADQKESNQSQDGKEEKK